MCVANDQPMTVVGVPDVVVVEAIHVDLELATVYVDVRDKQRRNVKSIIRTTSVWTFDQTLEFYLRP